MTDEIERAKFEKWADRMTAEGWSVPLDRTMIKGKKWDSYSHGSTQLAWKSWQAALSSRGDAGTLDTLLRKLDKIARRDNAYEYGLPLHDENLMALMRQAIAESALAHREECQICERFPSWPHSPVAHRETPPDVKTVLGVDMKLSPRRFICLHGDFPNPCEICQGTFTNSAVTDREAKGK